MYEREQGNHWWEGSASRGVPVDSWAIAGTQVAFPGVHREHQAELT